ncbi:MAG: hypothetical protein NVV68_11325 [Dokdonella sp.]|nr:hypothetical protein [Dokdonella sp.]
MIAPASGSVWNSEWRTCTVLGFCGEVEACDRSVAGVALVPLVLWLNSVLSIVTVVAVPDTHKAPPAPTGSE